MGTHSRLGPTKVSEMRTYAGNFELLHCDNEVVRTWGRLSGLAMKCVVHGLPLLTHDDDFKPLEALGLTLL